jgi:hypothetical protein
MPGVHKNPVKNFRPDPATYEAAKVAAAEVGSDMNAHLNAFLRWLTHQTDELPRRPDKPSRRGKTTDPDS